MSNILGTKIQVKQLIVHVNLIMSLIMTTILIEVSVLLAGASLAYAAISIALIKKYPIKGLIENIGERVPAVAVKGYRCSGVMGTGKKSL